MGRLAKRVVAVFTGNRAEYGLQYPILKAIDAHPDLDYRLIVAGAHLEESFGRTRAEIERDGFTVHAEVKIDLEDDSLDGTARAIGTGIVSMSEALATLRPDILVAYADRFEAFAAVIAGTQMGIPTAHIEGGDITEGGALDDSVRHAMTKLAHLHFTTHQQATDRVLAMGEEPWRVHTVGFSAIDLIAEGNYAMPDEVIERYRLDLSRPLVILTQHSVTTEFRQALKQLRPSLAAMTSLAEEGAQVILTYPNNDAGGRRILAELEAYVAGAPPGAQLHRSLGHYNYHGLLALARDPLNRVACAGNSSSGIKETPAFGCPALNIGSRQRSRLRAANVIDVDYDADMIYAATRRCFFDEDFRQLCRTVENPYGVGDAGRRVAYILATIPFDTSLVQKGMTLRGEVRDGWSR